MSSQEQCNDSKTNQLVVQEIPPLEVTSQIEAKTFQPIYYTPSEYLQHLEHLYPSSFDHDSIKLFLESQSSPDEWEILLSNLSSSSCRLFHLILPQIHPNLVIKTCSIKQNDPGIILGVRFGTNNGVYEALLSNPNIKLINPHTYYPFEPFNFILHSLKLDNLDILTLTLDKISDQWFEEYNELFDFAAIIDEATFDILLSVRPIILRYLLDRYPNLITFIGTKLSISTFNGQALIECLYMLNTRYQLNFNPNLLLSLDEACQLESFTLHGDIVSWYFTYLGYTDDQKTKTLQFDHLQRSFMRHSQHYTYHLTTIYSFPLPPGPITSLLLLPELSIMKQLLDLILLEKRVCLDTISLLVQSKPLFLNLVRNHIYTQSDLGMLYQSDMTLLDICFCAGDINFAQFLIQNDAKLSTNTQNTSEILFHVIKLFKKSYYYHKFGQSDDVNAMTTHRYLPNRIAMKFFSYEHNYVVSNDLVATDDNNNTNFQPKLFNHNEKISKIDDVIFTTQSFNQHSQVCQLYLQTLDTYGKRLESITNKQPDPNCLTHIDSNSHNDQHDTNIINHYSNPNNFEPTSFILSNHPTPSPTSQILQDCLNDSLILFSFDQACPRQMIQQYILCGANPLESVSLQELEILDSPFVTPSEMVNPFKFYILYPYDHDLNNMLERYTPEDYLTAILEGLCCLLLTGIKYDWMHTHVVDFGRKPLPQTSCRTPQY